MFTHNLDPILFDFGFIAIRWYSLAYIFGILFGWWYGKKIIAEKIQLLNNNFKIEYFDDLITYLILSIIIGGRLGYIIFYNFEYYIDNPLNTFKVWEGGMSFHGALAGIVFGTYLFSIKRNLETLFFLDIVACVAPVGIFLGRIANFINGELVGKATNVSWSVIFPSVDLMPRHPCQLYEAFLEGLILFYIMRVIFKRKDYKIGICSFYFLIFYGIFRTFSEIFREPDYQIGYILNIFSMGTFLSIIMVLVGLVMLVRNK